MIRRTLLRIFGASLIEKYEIYCRKKSQVLGCLGRMILIWKAFSSLVLCPPEPIITLALTDLLMLITLKPRLDVCIEAWNSKLALDTLNASCLDDFGIGIGN